MNTYIDSEGVEVTAIQVIDAVCPINTIHGEAFVQPSQWIVTLSDGRNLPPFTDAAFRQSFTKVIDVNVDVIHPVNTIAIQNAVSVSDIASIDNLATVDIASISTVEIPAIQPMQVEQDPIQVELQPIQVEFIATQQVDVIETQKIQSISTNSISVLETVNISTLQSVDLISISSEQVQSLLSEQIQSLN